MPTLRSATTDVAGLDAALDDRLRVVGRAERDGAFDGFAAVDDDEDERFVGSVAPDRVAGNGEHVRQVLR